MVEIDFVGIAVVEIVLVDIDEDGAELALVYLTFSHNYSSSRYPSSSLGAAEMICNISHCVLQFYKIYNTY